jgi:hypothetical protein
MEGQGGGNAQGVAHPSKNNKKDGRPVEISADAVEDLGAVLVLLPLVGVELENRLVHQVGAVLEKKIIKIIEASYDVINFKFAFVWSSFDGEGPNKCGLTFLSRQCQRGDPRKKRKKKRPLRRGSVVISSVRGTEVPGLNPTTVKFFWEKSSAVTNIDLNVGLKMKNIYLSIHRSIGRSSDVLNDNAGLCKFVVLLF